MTIDLILVGAGRMAIEYTRVLKSLGLEFTVVGRGNESASRFEEATQVEAVVGGIEAHVRRHPVPAVGIVAVPETELFNSVMVLLGSGCRRILVEKPAGLSFSELSSLSAESRATGAEIYVAYNRRHYQSVKTVRTMIEADGGLRSVEVDFTEFSHVVADLDTSASTKERWLLANSSHVLDLLFHLAGVPRSWTYLRQGATDWHPTGDVFVGSGISDRGVMFSFVSDWGAPGRWKIECRTAHRKLLLQPLEELKQMDRASLHFRDVEADFEIDKQFKPGLWNMTRDFWLERCEHLCSIDEHVVHSRHYFEIAGYELN